MITTGLLLEDVIPWIALALGAACLILLLCPIPNRCKTCEYCSGKRCDKC